ncbi:MAG: pilus assembly protein TadG-related protein, partial [Gemmatimonadaceae bacterium]
MKKRHSRRGSTMIMVLLLMVSFIGVAAIALDLGRMYLFRTQLHTATDVGALAGVQRLLRNDYTTADDSAVAYTQAHLVEGAVPSVGVGQVVPGYWDFAGATFTPAAGGSWTDPTNNAVQVTATHTAGYTFGQYFGLTTNVRTATSIAAIGSVGASNCIKPWAIPYQLLLEALYPSSAPGSPYDSAYNLTTSDVATLSSFTTANNVFLKVGNPAQSVLPGAFYAVREPPLLYANGTTGSPWPPSGSNYAAAIAAGCSNSLMAHTIGPGDWLQSDQGNTVGPTKSGTAALCGVPPSANFTCSPPVPIKMAMWDVYNPDPTASGTTVNCPPRCFRVKYVGVFVVTGFATNPGPSNEGVTGYFNALVTTGAFSGTPGPL